MRMTITENIVVAIAPSLVTRAVNCEVGCLILSINYERKNCPLKAQKE